MKAGWKTSEFWVAIVGQIIPLLVLLGVLSPDDSTQVSDAWVQFVESVFALLASAAPIIMYIWSRTKIKTG